MLLCAAERDMTKRNAVARQVAGYEEAKQAGDFYFMHHHFDPIPIGLIHTCPCGCGLLGSLYFEGRRPKDWAPGAEWKVTGTWPKVSLTPSIGFHGAPDSPKGPDGYHWHGFLTNGVFEEC